MKRQSDKITAFFQQAKATAEADRDSLKGPPQTTSSVESSKDAHPAERLLEPPAAALAVVPSASGTPDSDRTVTTATTQVTQETDVGRNIDDSTATLPSSPSTPPRQTTTEAGGTSAEAVTGSPSKKPRSSPAGLHKNSSPLISREEEVFLATSSKVYKNLTSSFQQAPATWSDLENLFSRPGPALPFGNSSLRAPPPTTTTTTTMRSSDLSVEAPYPVENLGADVLDADKQSALSSGFLLPESLLHLERQFVAVDASYAFLQIRKVGASFPKLKESIELMTKRRFEESHLAQILYIYPGCFRVERANKQLMVFCDEYPLPSDRTREFRKRLEAFYDQQRGSKAYVADVQVPQAELPVEPEDQKYSYREFTKSVQAKLPHIESPIIRRVLEETLSKKPSSASSTMSVAATNTSKDPSKTSLQRKPSEDDPLKGLSSSFIEKVRARQVEKQLREEAGYTEKMEKKRDLRELVRVMDSVKMVLSSEKKRSMMLSQLISKVEQGSKHPTSKDRLKCLFDVLFKEASDWCESIQLSSGVCFALRQDADFKVPQVKERLRVLYEGNEQPPTCK